MGCAGIAHTIFIIIRELQILKNEGSLRTNKHIWVPPVVMQETGFEFL